MSELSWNELPKLPQARKFLRAAQWGFQDLVANQREDREFIFYVIGILSALRAVQHVLLTHDRDLSHDHQQVIDEWKSQTRDWRSIPELAFIKQSRDDLIKKGVFRGYAIATDTGIGEGDNYRVTQTDYEMSYWVDGSRFDFKLDMERALNWCEAQLSQIEARLPPRYRENAT